jgi:hypothetical protein
MYSMITKPQTISIQKYQTKPRSNSLKTMSLVTSSICLSHVGLPVDIVNVIAKYIGTNSKWLPWYETDGTLRWKINEEFFSQLSEILSFKPAIIQNFRTIPCPVTIGTQQYPNSESIMVAPRLISPTEVQLTLYTTVEVNANVNRYLSVLCNWSFSETASDTHFIKGTVYSPGHPDGWERSVSFMEIDNHTIRVNLTEVPYVWNNAGEYVPAHLNIPPPIWVHDTAEDNIGWA